MGLGAFFLQGLGFRGYLALRVRVWGLGVRVFGAIGLRVQGLGLRRV